MRKKTKNLTGFTPLNPCQGGVRSRRNLTGFTFIEIIVAVFIFSLVSVTSTAIFSKMLKNYGRAKDIQRNMESAQQAMNLMAKTIRTSAIDSDGDPTVITSYDYSQAKCINYSYDARESTILYQECSPAAFVDIGDCDLVTCGYSAPSNMTAGVSALNFNKTVSSDTIAGRATISMEVCPAGICAGQDRVRIQSTVSLRDGYLE